MGKGGEGHEMGGSGGEREAWEWGGKMEGEMWGEWGESEVRGRGVGTGTSLADMMSCRSLFGLGISVCFLVKNKLCSVVNE